MGENTKAAREGVRRGAGIAGRRLVAAGLAVSLDDALLEVPDGEAADSVNQSEGEQVFGKLHAEAEKVGGDDIHDLEQVEELVLASHQLGQVQRADHQDAGEDEA